MKWLLVLALVAVCLTVMVSAHGNRGNRRNGGGGGGGGGGWRCRNGRRGRGCNNGDEQPPEDPETAAPPTLPDEINGTSDNGCMFFKCIFAPLDGTASPCPSPLGDCNIAGAAAGQYKCCEV